MKTVILGAGITGRAVRRYIVENEPGADVMMYDDAPVTAEGLTESDFIKNPAVPDGTDRIITSPGVPGTHPLLTDAAERSVPVIGAMEFAAAKLGDERIIAVTGTNGKSTTVSLISSMLKADGHRVFLGGNIGNPLVNAVGKGYEYIVVELSSYHLETLRSLRPHTGLILNISPDHLDRYETYEQYVVTKASLARLVRPDGLLILNSGDEALEYAVPPFSGTIRRFSARKPGDASFTDGVIRTGPLSVTFAETTLDGEHNVENIMAACLSVQDIVSDHKACERAVKQFTPLRHRMQYVDTVNGVVFVNDSKGTNVGAVEKSMKGFRSRELVLILGGRDKGSSYALLRELADDVCAGVVLLGEATPRIAKYFEGFSDVKYADDMADAVETAYGMADSGQTVLLSPACSSFDMYGNFRERGDDFIEKVGDLAGRVGE